MTTTWVPLRENYFATPLLSAKEKAYLVRKSCEAAQEVVERARSTGGPVQWRHVEKYQDVQIYAGTPRRGALTQPADVVSMCGVTSVAASVKEVAALFDLSTTRAMKEFSVENRELFYDAIVLYTLSPRTKEKPLHQVTAKWVATRSPRGVADRDFCYLECQDKFVDSHGRKGWVMCLHSIKLPGCDELTREFGFVRGSFYHSGVIVVETDRPGFVDVIHILQMNYKQNAHVSPSFVRERVAFVAKVRAMVRSTRLNEQRYLSDLELVPKKYRSRCTVCQDSFSLLLLRKMNCRKCGEVVCGACSKEFDVRNAKFMETVKLRICMHCFQLITTGPKAQIPMLEPSAASSSASLLGYVEDEHRASFLTQAPTSAAEMARASASQQRRTKIFLQSMQRQRTAAAGPPPRSSQSQGPPGYYHSSSQLRASQQLQASQQGMYPTRGSVLDHSPYSRETITYGSSVSVQRPPPSAASIFDRPHNAASAVAAPPQSMPRDFEYNRQSEHSQEYAARSRSNTQQSASRVNRASSRQENYSHNSAYRFEQQQQHQHGASLSGSFEYGMTEPSPVPYPSSLHDSESKRRDSVSSESSTSSIDIDVDEGRRSANQSAPENAGHASSTLVSAAAIPRSPPPYYSSEIAGHSDHHQGSSPSYPVASSQSPGSNSDTKAQLNSAAVSTGLTGQRTSEASEGLSKRQSELAFDLRESELGINTARCDRSFLDSDMRQFHDALWVMKNEQRSLESKDEQSAYAVGSSGSQPEQELQRSRAGSTRSSESKASGWSAQSSSRDRESDAVFAVSHPLFPVNNHVTSPRNSYEGMPSLYAKPQDPKRESPHAMQRQGTIAFTASDNDLPPSYSSSVARLSAGSVSKEDRAVSRHSSSSVSSTTSSSAKAKRLASAVVKDEDEDEDDESNGPQSFFGAISDDAPPQFQQPRTMAGFSPSATYEVPQRSEAETKELLRKLSAPAMVSGGREGSKGEPEHENSANVQSALLFHDDDEERESDFTAFDEPIVREEQAPQPKAGAAVRFQLEKVEDVDDNEEEDEEDDMLLSARSLYKTFGSSKKITSLVGENDAFQRTFDKIQASFDMLSSDDESEDDDDYSVVKRVVQT
ncbi:hypothetical protein PybrP1_006766 [[Pythium] brassicae (nom. inval.)]|nr:hypothetical protein PybrP1_006766 [[Pythium] brassicae (nom. inval.)]